MAETTIEALTRGFYDWELRGRGWQSYAHQVALEPAFRPFWSFGGPPGGRRDDGRKHTFLSSLVDRLLAKPRAEDAPLQESIEPPPRDGWTHNQLIEIEVLVPEDVKLSSELSAGWLHAIASASGPLAFELVGTGSRVSVRFAIDAADLDGLRRQLTAFAPVCMTREAPRLRDLWRGVGTETAAVEFGLAREFMLPLRESGSVDPLTSLIGALAAARNDEVAALQVLFESARHPWADSISRAVTTYDGSPFFVDAPEITSLAKDKCSSPLYAVAVRAIARAADPDRPWDLLRGIGGALAQHGSPDRNEFVPLAAEDANQLVEDILDRSTHRSGMILSLDELVGLVRLPGEAVRSPALVRIPEPEETLPAEVRAGLGIALGEGRHRSATVPVQLSDEARLQHLYVIGGTGTGKSTLLENLILQDIGRGAGVGVIDPHGDLVEDILARVPEHRIKDVVLFDPADPDHVVGWNILGAHSAVEKDLLASDLVAVFRRLSTSWGDQMNVVLANAVMAFLESRREGTLSDLRKFLLDDTYRTAFLGTVEDDHVVSFWKEEFELLASKKPQAPILTRLDTFLRSRLVREAVTELQHPLNFRALIDDGAIFLAKLSQGAIGEEIAALLGSVLTSKFHQVSLSRQDTAVADRRPFYLYLDEFQTVATPSMASLFSGVRKYRLSITVAHQDLYQLHKDMPEVERAVLANAYTRVIFRVSDEDARKLERGVSGFEAEDLTNLGRGVAVCRTGKKDNAFKLYTKPLPELSAVEADERRERIRAESMTRYGRPRKQERSSHTRLSEARPAPPRSPERKPPAQPPAEPAASLDPAQLPGRGGAVHKYIQGLIKEWGRTQGFRPEIEMQLDDGKRVDVALIRGDLKVACEIAGTSTIEQETRNIRKCLAGPFQHVVSVSLDRAFLGQIEKALDGLTDTERSRVQILTPEELMAFLRTLGPETSQSRVRGYTVTTRHNTAEPLTNSIGKSLIADVMFKSAKRVREQK